MPILTFESARLSFRPMTLNDDDLVRHNFTDPDVMRYVGGLMAPEDISTYLPIWTRRCAEGCIGVWVVRDKKTQEKLGTTALVPMPIFEEDTNWDLVQGDGLPTGDIEIGYMFRRSAWGRGIATEACTRMVRFAFEDSKLTQIVAVTDVSNDNSGRVLMKSGFRRVGWRRAYQLDLPAYEINKAEWLAAHAG